MPPLAERSLEQLTRRLRRLAISEGRLQTMALEFFSRPSPASVEAARTWAQRGRQMTLDRRPHIVRQADADGHVGAELAQVLDEVVREGVVVIDDQ